MRCGAVRCGREMCSAMRIYSGENSLEVDEPCKIDLSYARLYFGFVGVPEDLCRTCAPSLTTVRT